MKQQEIFSSKYLINEWMMTTMEIVKMLINFNSRLIFLIRKYRVHMQFIILTYSATVLARQTTLHDDCMWLKFVVSKKND
jgi:hypothetical protein